MAKGNKGEAAKKQKKRALILFVTFCCIMGYSYYTTHPNVVGKRRRRKQKNRLKKKASFSSPSGAKQDAVQAAMGNLHLIEIRPGSHGKNHPRDETFDFEAVVGQFCKLDWEVHKQDPSSVPMFKDLVAASKGCDHLISIPLIDVVAAAKKLDDSVDKNNSHDHFHSIPPTGFVFHESRCGSTLVANSLAAVAPQKHRVYSESSPLITAMKFASNHDTYEAKTFLQNVVHIMGRTNDPQETRLFYKIQSIGTTYIHTLRNAFPDVPWIFVYRDPVQVMMSHMPKKVAGAVCLRTKSNPPHAMLQLIRSMGSKPVKQMSDYEMCAAHLSYLCQSILNEQQSTGTGRMVNYEGLTDTLLDDIFPNYFGIPIAEPEIKLVLTVGKKYSKGRKGAMPWEEDSEEKDRKASKELKAAAETFLSGPFKTLTSLSKTPTMK